MTTFLVGFIVICAVGIAYNFTMKYKSLYEWHRKDRDGT